MLNMYRMTDFVAFGILGLTRKLSTPFVPPLCRPRVVHLPDVPVSQLAMSKESPLYAELPKLFALHAECSQRAHEGTCTDSSDLDSAYESCGVGKHTEGLGFGVECCDRLGECLWTPTPDSSAHADTSANAVFDDLTGYAVSQVVTDVADTMEVSFCFYRRELPACPACRQHDFFSVPALSLQHTRRYRQQHGDTTACLSVWCQAAAASQC